MIYEIKELLEFININVPSQQFDAKISLLGNRKLTLLEHIQASDNVQDASICQFLYAKSSSNAYTQLKSRLYQNLLDIVLFGSNMESDVSDSFVKIRDRCYRNLQVIKFFATKELYRNLDYLSKKALKTSEKYEFNDISIEILRILLNVYGTLKRDKKKFNTYLTKYEKYSKIVEVENDYQILYYRLFIAQDEKPHSETDSIFEKVSIPKLDEYLNDPTSSFKLKFQIYNIKCVYYSYYGLFEEMHLAAIEGAEFIKGNHTKNDRLFLSFINKKFIAELKLRLYDSMAETLTIFNRIVKPNTFDFIIVNLYKLIMNLHLGNYTDACGTLIGLRTTSKKIRASVEIKEYIEICYAYLHFVNNTLELGVKELSKFRIYKFLNEVPAYQADKRGLNVSILILHVLFLLEKRKYGDIIDRVDALNQYSFRYLRKDDTFRSNCFIRMIIQMTKAGFHPIRTERYTAELAEKLKGHPLELSDQPVEVEIIPYEHLWDLVMQVLERNSKIKRGRPKKQILDI